MLREIDTALTPIPAAVLAALVAETIALWRAPSGGAVTAGFYLEALEEFPTHVVAQALKRVRLEHRYPSAPLPADFRNHALTIVAPLRGAQVRARIASKRFADAATRPLAPRAATNVHELPPRAPLVRDRSDGRREVDLGNVDANLARWAEQGGEGEI